MRCLQVSARLILALWLMLAPVKAWAGSMTLLGVGGGGSTAHAMVTPVMNIANAIAMGNSATNYTSFAGGIWGTTQNTRDSVIATAGTISALVVRMPTTIASGTYQITLFKNGVAAGSPGNFSCTVGAGTGPQTCADNTNTVSVVAGDRLQWQSVPTGTPAAQTAPTISAVFTSSANGEGFVTYSSNTGAPSSSVTSYNSFGSINTWGTSEPNVSTIVPTAGVLDHLYIYATGGPGAAKSYAFTILKNGSPAGSPGNVTCTITGAGTGAGINTCNDLTNSISVAAGDTISIQAVPTGTPTGNVAFASMRWVPTVPGEAIVMNAAQIALSTASARFEPLSDTAILSAEATSVVVAPSAFTVKNLYAALDAAPGAGSPSRALVLRKGTGAGQSNAGSPSAVGCTMTTTASCNDTTNSYAASASDLLDLSETPASTPAASVYFKTSYVFYTP